MIKNGEGEINVYFGSNEKEPTLCTSPWVGVVKEEPASGFCVQQVALGQGLAALKAGEELPNDIQMDGPRFNFIFKKVHSIENLIQHLMEARRWLQHAQDQKAKGLEVEPEKPKESADEPTEIKGAKRRNPPKGVS